MTPVRTTCLTTSLSEYTILRIPKGLTVDQEDNLLTVIGELLLDRKKEYRVGTEANYFLYANGNIYEDKPDHPIPAPTEGLGWMV